MCPVCITTAALIATSATSAGGLASLVVKKFRTKNVADNVPTNPNQRRITMATSKMELQHPKVVSPAEWLDARKEHLAQEKEFTRLRDKLSRERRELPWEKVEKQYVFEGPNGKETLADLFGKRSQLIVYHFMFGPGWKEGCPSCSYLADHYDGAAIHLANRDVTLAVVSRTTLAEIETFK
jgi:predicted dithiol-disulfide oxidoreductase (DUF899 family)